MPTPNPAALDFLLTRRSRLAKTLSNEGPTAEEIRTMLTAAVRTPDHGILTPFRFLVLGDAARARLSRAVAEGMAAAGEAPDRTERQSAAMLHGGVAVAVIAAPKPHETIPAWEQHLAAGGVCLTLLNAALAMGYGANWLTGWAAQSRAFMEGEMGLAPHEFVAGFIHIGRETLAPKERRRADPEELTTWVEA